MIKMILSMMMINLSILMMFLKTPLSMGLIILTQTLLMCLIAGMINSTYWFSYILFITFLGGLLVLFIYVASVASNNMFKLSSNMILFLLLMVMISTLISYFLYNLNWMNFNINNLDMNKKMNMFMFFNNEYKMNLNKLYNNYFFMMMSLLIIYLFIALICMVKITNIFFGPLRSSSY
uniref:NADH-ubiquinone oxidoreductase chain 6 n=1 Tax=Scirpophaga incertulas TaxID=72366 RepID=W0FC34_9NEOP|nr:NADH dehydrogenase subunit 6 [Scirpophaga incertulas]AHF21014.1 NADH dehydrogenase subunit 6 [Scirpophaga incertulas]